MSIFHPGPFRPVPHGSISADNEKSRARIDVVDNHGCECHYLGGFPFAVSGRVLARIFNSIFLQPFLPKIFFVSPQTRHWSHWFFVSRQTQD